MSDKYIVSVELRSPHKMAYQSTKRFEEKFEKEADAIMTYGFLLNALHTLEAFSE